MSIGENKDVQLIWQCLARYMVLRVLHTTVYPVGVFAFSNQCTCVSVQLLNRIRMKRAVKNVLRLVMGKHVECTNAEQMWCVDYVGFFVGWMSVVSHS